MDILNRVGTRVQLNGEEFLVSDVNSVVPSYKMTISSVHYCDGKRHYVSDGKKQQPCPIPYEPYLEIFSRIPEIRMCKAQRLHDERYFDNLRNARR